MKNELVLYGTVGSGGWWDDGDYFTAGTVRAALEGRTGPLTVRINSGGGIASEGQAIYTMLRDYAEEHGEVHTINDAVAMSAASLIFMAGDRRTMRLGSYLLIHDPATPWSEGRGTEEDHRKTAEMLGVVSDAYAEIYAIRAGISRAEARDVMKAETILASDAAAAQGFATATEAVEAVEAAAFDYRIYAHAPQELRERSKALGRTRGRAAIAAMMAGTAPRAKEEGRDMAGRNAGGDPATQRRMAGRTPTDNTPDDDKTLVTPPDDDNGRGAGSRPEDQEIDQDAPGQAPAPSRRPDPYEPPESSPDPNAVQRERLRAKRIRDVGMASGAPVAMVNDLIDRGIPLERALDRISAHWAEQGGDNQPMFGQRTQARVNSDARERFAIGAQKALLMKVGIREGGERNEFSSMSLAEMARHSLQMAGVRQTFTSRLDMIGAALTMTEPGYHTTSDLANVLGNVAKRSVLRGWEEAAEQLAVITGDPITLTDFKPTTLVGLGYFDTLAEIPEGAEYKYGTMGDRKTTFVLGTYGRLFAITRQALINDDLNVLGDTPRKMGRAARRTVGNMAWAFFTTNPVLDDGIALFEAATHKNLLTGGGSALSITSLQAAVTLMRTQTAEGIITPYAPRYLVVPPQLEFVAREIVESTVYPAANRGMQANPVAGIVEVIVEPRLSGNATAWYLVADPQMNDVIRLGYLDGVEEPFLDQKDNWNSDGTEFKVRIDAGAAPGDFRAFVKANGA